MNTKLKLYYGTNSCYELKVKRNYLLSKELLNI